MSDALNQITIFGELQNALERIAELEARLALRDAQPVAWRWDVVEGSPQSKRWGARFGFYTKDPKTLGIPVPHPSYKWTPLYDKPESAFTPTDLQILSCGPGEEGAAWPYEAQIYFGRAVLALRDGAP